MDWKDIRVTKDNKGFTYNEKPLFDKAYASVLKFHAPGIAPVKDDNGWYHIDALGRTISDEKYDRVFGFYFNRASVVKDDLWFHINEKGNRLYSENFAWSGNYQEEICTVRDFNNSFFHIDLNGDRLYNSNYIYAGDFKDGFASVRFSNGKYKHIDTNGKYLNDRSYSDLGVFHKDFAIARDELGWHHINKKGEELYGERYLMIEPFYNGFSVVDKFDSTKQIIDEDGKVVLELI